jgi:hypothetical protein
MPQAQRNVNLALLAMFLASVLMRGQNHRQSQVSILYVLSILWLGFMFEIEPATEVNKK